MSRDARIAMEMIEAALPKAGGAVLQGNDRLEIAEAYDRAARLVREAARRERRALESVRIFAPAGSRSSPTLEAVIAQLPKDDDAVKRLWAYYAGVIQAWAGPKTIVPNVAGGIVPSASVPVPTRNLVPVVTDSVRDFLERRSELERPQTLHPLMQYEALNFADGKPTVGDIHSAVAAEADSAGAWYYGTVTRADIEKLFESAAKVGLVNLVAPRAEHGARQQRHAQEVKARHEQEHCRPGRRAR